MMGQTVEQIKVNDRIFLSSHTTDDIGFRVYGQVAYATAQELADALRDAGITLPEPTPEPLKQGDIVQYVFDDGVFGPNRKVMLIDDKQMVLSSDNNFDKIGGTRSLLDYPTTWRKVDK